MFEVDNQLSLPAEPQRSAMERNNLRYIEVVTNIRVEHEVESYEAMLELSTSAKKNVACFSDALELREAILAALKKCGLTDAEIREGGGQAIQNSWSSSKSIVHRILIQNKNIETLMSAMAVTEKHFATLRQPFFGRIRHNFTFHPPVPVYANNLSVDDALRESMQCARRTAALIAGETGCRLGVMLLVAEQIDGRSPRPSETPLPYDEGDYAHAAYCLSEDDSIADGAFTELAKSTANTARRFRVRFGVVDAEPSDEPHPRNEPF